MITLTQFLAYLAVIGYCLFMWRELWIMFVAQCRFKCITTLDYLRDWMSFSIIFLLGEFVFLTTVTFSKYFHIMGYK